MAAYRSSSSSDISETGLACAGTDFTTFANELTAELAGPGGHDAVLVANAILLRVLYTDPRFFIPYIVERPWDP